MSRTGAEPLTEPDARYSGEDATPTGWPDALRELTGAGVYWLSTVRPDGRPHVTPLIGVWLDGALHFSTGPAERKAMNLERNRHVVLTTGRNTYGEGLDVVVEGDAVRVRDDGRLRRIADAFVDKYGEEWRFEVHDGLFHHGRRAGQASAPGYTNWQTPWKVSVSPGSAQSESWHRAEPPDWSKFKYSTVTPLRTAR
jgi:hypothetical protein